MPLLSLRTRLVALFLVSLATAAFLFAAVAMRQFSGEERSRARSELSRQALESGRLIEEFAEQRLADKAGAPADFATRLGGITAAHVYFVGRSGLQPPIDEVRFAKAPKGTEGRLDWKLLGKTGKAQRAQTLDLKLADGTKTLAAASGFRYGGELIGAIVVARPVRTINASTLVQGRRFILPLLLAVAAAALVAVLLSRRITRPVQELTAASERIARGDYDVHLASKGPDELGQLALRFEQMARQLKEASEHERNFLMRISHELRTPLTAIQGHVQAIADGVIVGEDEQHASLDIVLTEAGRLQRLIGDLLDLARLETRKFSLNVEEVDLLDVCESAAGAQREEARSRHLHLHVNAAAKPVVVGDGDRILQIVTNLVTNALHATPADGEVTVDVALADGVGLVVVSDTGPGIPQAERESILRPFVTSDVRHGVGLGLPVASELAQAMGGTLVVGERPGGGAAFTLRLPLARGGGAPEPGAPPVLPPRAQPESELVAE
jgi:signal transduction histidine kinase